VLCLGDSLTAGHSRADHPDKPYSARLEQRLREGSSADTVIVNAGIALESTTQMLLRLPRVLHDAGVGPASGVDALADVVLILGGTNDLSGDLPPAHIADNLIKLHQMAHNVGAVTGFLTVPELGMGDGRREADLGRERRQAVNRVLTEYAQRHSDMMFIVDVANSFPQDNEHAALWEADGAHFSARGYEALGDLLAEAEVPIGGTSEVIAPSDAATAVVAPTAGPAMARKIVLCFGDSLTEGYLGPDDDFKPYSDQLRQRLRDLASDTSPCPVIINAGVTGETSGDLRMRLFQFFKLGSILADEQGKLLDSLPDIVLILGGTNDLAYYTAEHTINHLVNIHEFVRSFGARTGVLTIPDVRFGDNLEREPFKEKQTEINKLLRDHAEQHCDKSFLVDVAAAFPQDPQDPSRAEIWGKDGMHFTAKGYEALADLLADALIPILATS